MRRLEHHHAAHDVDVVAREPVLVRRGEALVDVGAREVDQGLQRAELGSGGDAGLAVLVAGDVGAHEARAIAQLVGDALPSLFIDIGDHDAVAGALEGAHDSGTDDGRPTGDDRRPVVRQAHSPLLLAQTGERKTPS
jgi:hypothetical protein